MSVASAGTGSTDLFTLLQQLSGQAQTQASSVTTPVPTDTPTKESGESKGAHHHHHHGGGISSQVESVVTSALESAPSGSDPNQVVQDAIEAALKKANGQQGTATNGGTATKDGTQTAASQGPGDFQKLLQSYGIDPKQFRQDFQEAVQGLQQDGSVDFSTLLRSFPAGSAVNTVA